MAPIRHRRLGPRGRARRRRLRCRGNHRAPQPRDHHRRRQMGSPWRRQRGFGLRARELSDPETCPAPRPLGAAMNENVARPIALAHEPPAFELNPNAHRIASDQEALAVARELAADFAQGAAQRDRERRLPAEELDRFSGSGLWGITVPKAYGGAGVSFATLAEGIAIIATADPNLGQLPQNHLAALDAIRVTASEEQKLLWFSRVLQGYRLGNAFSEAKSKHVGAFETTLSPDGEGFVVNGEKFYATGALFAHFIHIGAVGPDGNVYLAIVPRDARGLTIVDNWSSFGQRTTASGNVFLDNVRVKAEGVIPAYLGAERPSSNGAVSQIIQAAVDAGIARGAIDDTIAFVRQYTRPWIDSGQERGSDDVFTISQIGDLKIKLHAAEALLEKAGLAIDAIVGN